MPRLGSRVRIPFPAPENKTRDCGRNACNSGFSFGSQRTVDAVSDRNGHTVESPGIPPKNPHEWQRSGNGLCTCEGDVQDYPKRRAKPAGRRWASIAFDRLCASGVRMVRRSRGGVFHSQAPPRVVPFRLWGLPYEMASSLGSRRVVPARRDGSGGRIWRRPCLAGRRVLQNFRGHANEPAPIFLRIFLDPPTLPFALSAILPRHAP